MLTKLKRKIYNYLNFDNKIKALEHLIIQESDSQKVLLGKLLTDNLLKKGTLKSIHEAEFSIFSQGGDDGIIQYLVSKVDCPKRFVDLGAGTYGQPDTRFLLQHSNWSGLAVDASPVKEKLPLFDLETKQTFITAENVNELVAGEVGLLNIDIDGNDYWVWKSIKINPAIVIVEYNPFFGLHPVTIPYNKDFVRTKSDYGTIYCGASLVALCHLAKEKGYSFVGCSRQGVNAYFVRNDKVGDLQDLTPEEGFVMTQCREHRDKFNKKYLMNPEEATNFFLKDALFFDVERKREHIGLLTKK